MLVTGSRLLVSFVKILVFLASVSRFPAEEYGYTTSNPAGYTPYQWESEHNDKTSSSRRTVYNDDDDLDDKLPTERICNDDDYFDFTEDSLLDGTLSPFIYAALGGATVLAIIGIVYTCYKGCVRRCRWQQAQNLAMIALPPQVLGPLGRTNQMMQLVNEQ